MVIYKVWVSKWPSLHRYNNFWILGAKSYTWYSYASLRYLYHAQCWHQDLIQPAAGGPIWTQTKVARCYHVQILRNFHPWKIRVKMHCRKINYHASWLVYASCPCSLLAYALGMRKTSQSSIIRIKLCTVWQAVHYTFGITPPLSIINMGSWLNGYPEKLKNKY